MVLKDETTIRSLRARYDISKHHAWAGTVLLSVLLAIRIFLEMADNNYFSDTIFIALGVVLTGYILTALFFTYKYRKVLYHHEIRTQNNIDTTVQNIASRGQEEIVKNMYKLEKKKSKIEAKRIKKAAKK